MKLYKSLLALALAAMSAVGFSACENEQECPPFVIPEGGLEGDGTWSAPYNTNMVIGIVKSTNSDYVESSVEYKTSGVWVTGYIVGYVDTNISYTALSSNNCKFTTPATIGTNCLLAATPDETDYNNCVVVQLSTTGNVRSNLSLVDHPENLGKLVSLRGDVQKYFGKPGLKSTTAFNWGGEGIDDGSDAPSSEKVSYSKATSITSGKAYGIVASGKLAQPSKADNSYGYLYVEDVTVSSDKFEASNMNGFVFTDACDGSWYISDEYGRFLYMEGTFTSFQLSQSLNKSNNNYRWKAEVSADGTWMIVNVGNNNTIQYSSNYSSYGAYSSKQDGGVYPVLYEMDGEPVKQPDLSGSSAPETPVTPPSEGAGSESSPYSVAQVLSGAASGTGYVKGYIVGFVPGKVLSEGVFTASGAVATNILIADSKDCTDISKCAPVQLPSGAVRTGLNLLDNPGNLGKEVVLCGSFESYFGTSGVKSVTSYTLDGVSGGTTPSEPVTPPSGSVTFAKTTTVTSGATYAFVNPSTGAVCVPIAQSYTYGYLLTEAATASGTDEITTSATNGFVITAVSGGYTITDCYGRYLGMDGTHAGSIQLYTSAQSKGETTWALSFESNGQLKMVNALSGLMIVWKEQYSNFAPGETNDSYMPLLYIKK